MLPLLKSQIFQFWSKFVSFSQVTSQQIGFSKLWLCHFLVYIAKLPHAKKLRKPTEKILRKMHHRWRNRHMARRTGLIL